MWILFFLVGGLGFLVCLVTLIIKAIRKKPKKVTAILMTVFLVMGVSSMVYAMSTPAIDVARGNYVDVMAGKLNEQIVEIKGDIVKIENLDNGMYFVQLKASDGDYELYTTEDVPGQFPKEGDSQVRVYISPTYTDNGTLVITIVSFPK